MAASVQVYQLDLASLRPFVPELSSLLVQEELDKASRFRMPGDGDRYICAHGMLRKILAGRVGREPRSLRFDCGPQGKPALCDADGVAFNLSHSGDWAVVAVTDASGVGVDVERVREQRDELELAQRFFAPAEAKA